MALDANDYAGSITFLTPEDLNRPLPISIGLSGGSGTGKTYSALLLASGIADGMTGQQGAPIAFVDTENRRGLHYRQQFPQILGHYIDFGPTDQNGNLVGYPPERWIALIDAVEKAGVTAMVVDSFSHAWEGINGVLDLQAAELERLVEAAQARNPNRQIDPNQHSQLAWASIKPRYRRLVNRIIRSSVNTLLCTRAKPVMQKWDGRAQKEVNARKTKTRRGDVPWDVAADGDLIFEMTAMMILDPEHPGAPRYQIKVADQFKSLFHADKPITAATGRAMAEWSRGRGDAQKEKELMDAARAKARNGTAAMREFWTGLDAARQGILRTILPELQETAASADKANREDDDPFAVGPTPEQLAAAEAEAMEAIAQRDAAIG